MKRAHALVLGLLAVISIGTASLAALSKSPAPPKAWSKIQVDPNPAPVVQDQTPVMYESVANTDAAAAVIPNNPDVAVTSATNTTQSENSIFVSPTNPQILLNSNNSSDWSVTQIFGASYWVSTDGGATWVGSNDGAGGPNSGDPAAAIDLNGRMYIGYISSTGGMGISYSTDNGSTWTARTVSSKGSLDKEHVWVDNSPTSAFSGRLYDAWSNFLAGDPNVNDIELSRSTDAGVTWSSPINLSNAVAAGSHNQGVNIQTGPNGEVYVTWVIYDSWPSNEVAIGFTKSTDGGTTWSTAARIRTIDGTRNTVLGGSKTMRHASFPSMSVNQQTGKIYIAWTNIGIPGTGTGDFEIYLISSTDGGASWGTPVRVNQDTQSNGKDQWMPWLACDPVTGDVSCIFYDSRNFVSNNATETFVAVSQDHGATWTDAKVSDFSWSGDGIIGFASNYAGDYLGISARNGNVVPCWGDDHSGNFLTYVSPFTLKAFRILHNPLANTADTLNPYEVVTTMVSDTTFLRTDSLSLFYRSSAVADTSYVRIPLVPTGNLNEYAASIPAQPVYSVVEYGLTAEDERGDRETLPVGFPSTAFSFHILGIPLLAYHPDSFAIELPSGYTHVESLVVRNDGTDDLRFAANVAESTVTANLIRTNQSLDLPWARVVQAQRVHEIPPSGTNSPAGSSLPLILTDPVGDDVPNGNKVDIVEIRGRRTSTDIVLQYVFTGSTSMSSVFGYLSLDTDRNPATGIAPPFGKPAQRVGAEFYIWMNSNPYYVDLYNQYGSYIATMAMTPADSTLMFALPVSLLGNPQGNTFMCTNNGDYGPEDWAPDAGYGVISSGPLLMTISPDSGVIVPGDSQFVELRCDARPVHRDTTAWYRVSVKAEDSLGSVAQIPVRIHVLPPDYYVDLSPTSASQSAPAGDTVWYADTLTNYGALNDFYQLGVTNAQWPTTVWDSAGLAEIAATPVMSTNNRYVIRLRVIIPATAGYGEQDTARLIVRSNADPMIAPTFEAITGSRGRPATIPWLDQFPSTVLDTLHWRSSKDIAVNDAGIGEPSPPYSLNLNGDPSSSDMVTSVPIDLHDQVQVALSYWYEQTGGGETPDYGDDLVFEVLDSALNWIEVSRQYGSWTYMNSFQNVEIILPRAAYHREFRLRIRSFGSACTCDDWFVDDVVIYAPIPPSICYAPDAFAFSLGSNRTTRDTLAICNNGPGELKFRLNVRDTTTGLAGTAFPRRIPSGLTELEGLPLTAGESFSPVRPPQPPTGAQSLGLADDFEDGDYNGWTIRSGAYLREVTSATAAAGSGYSFRQTGGSYNHCDGVSHGLPAAVYQYVGFYVRLSTTYDAAGYVVIGDENVASSLGAIFFMAHPDGHFYVYPGDASFPYQALRWYKVEFYIDWAAQNFDYYVEGNLVAPNLPFRNPTSHFSEIHLYNIYNSTAWWDQIVVGDDAFSGGWLAPSPVADTLAPGETSFVDLRISSAHRAPGNYRSTLEIRSNDPNAPLIGVPVDLRVKGPEIVVQPDSIADSVSEGGAVSVTIWVHNTGEEPLYGKSLAASEDWLGFHDSPYFRGPGHDDYEPFDSKFRPASAEIASMGRHTGARLGIAPGDSVPLAVTISAESLIPGDHCGVVLINTNDFDEGEFKLPICVHVGPDPNIVVVPESVVVVLDLGDSTDAALEVRNTGAGTLAFNASVETAIGAQGASQSANPYPASYYDVIPENAPDTRVGRPVTFGAGGPDSAGYTWIDSDQPGGPVFQWQDISSTGTPINSPSSHAFYGPFPIGFDFPFYDSAFGQFWISTAGFIGFGPSTYYDNVTNAPIPSTYPPNNIIAWHWSHLHPGYGASPPQLHYRREPDRLIVQFTRFRHFPDDSGPWITGQIILDRNGTIVLQTLEVQSGFMVNEATAGIENISGTVGLQVVFNAPYVHDHQAIRISRTPDWLSVTPDSGLVSPGGVLPLTLHASSAGVKRPDYLANVVFTSNDPDDDTVIVPVRLHVRSPAIGVHPDTLRVHATEGLATDSTLWLCNRGDGPLNASISTDRPWLGSAPGIVTISPAESLGLTIRVDASSLIPGLYAGTLTIGSDDFTRPIASVPVFAGVGPDPVIVITPESLAVTLISGDSATIPFEIANTGGGTLRFNFRKRWSPAMIAEFLGLIRSQSASDPGTPAPPPQNSVTDTAGHQQVAASIGGDHLFFDISNYGEIMPFQYPLGQEHLRNGIYLSGYTLAYRNAGLDHVAYAFYAERSGLQPVSWNVVVDDPDRTRVEVVVQTIDGMLRIRRLFDFNKHDKYVQIQTTLENISGVQLSDVLFKSGADWDMDYGADGDNWDFDSLRIMEYAYEAHFASIVPFTPPILLDVDGWGDYSRRSTTPNAPPGHYANLDGLLILDYGIGQLSPGQAADVFDAFVAGDNLSDLQGVADRAAFGGAWLTFAPDSGRVAPSATIAIGATFRTEGLSRPDYYAEALVTTNDPGRDTVLLPVHMHIRAPEIQIIPDDSLLVAATEGTVATDTLWVLNMGDADLHVSVAADSAWVSVSPPVAAVVPGDSVAMQVAINATLLLPGNHASMLAVTSDSPGNDMLHVMILADVGPDPRIVLPESLIVSIARNDSSDAPFVVGNSGLGTLRFEAEPHVGIGAMSSQSSPYPDSYYKRLAKGEADPRVGRPVVAGTGGPDSAGYRWIDSDEPAGPAFHWVDIAATGTPAPVLYNDDYAGPFPVGFAFPFYDSSYSQFWIAANGFIGFGPPYSYYAWWHDPIPSWYDPNNIIAWCWSDLYFVTGPNPTHIYYRNDADRLIVQFDRLRRCCGSDSWITAEIILARSGEITIQYREIQPGFEALWSTIGIENENGSMGLEVAFNTSYAHDSLALRISKIPQWLTISPDTGRVAGGGTASMTAHIRATDLSQPKYFGEILFTSNDPVEPAKLLPVRLEVVAPQIAIRPDTVQINATEGQITNSTMWINNSGTGPLRVVIDAADSLVIAVPDSIVIGPRDSTAIAVRANALHLLPGWYSRMLSISSNDPDHPELIVPVVVRVGPDPHIVISPESLIVSVVHGDSSVGVLRVGNSGEGTLAFTTKVEYIASPAAAGVTDPYPPSYYSVIAKGEPDPRVGRSVTLGSGGPDAAGYEWVDSDSPGGPAFQWIDISATGAPVVGLGDDNYAGPYPLGFDFPFYDSTFSQFWISSNGFIGFGPPTSYESWTNTPLPSADLPNNLIAWFMDDLFTRTTGPDPTQVSYLSEPDRVIIQFTRARHYCCQNGPWMTAEIILMRTGEILMQYETIQPGFPIDGSTVGQENQTGSVGFTVAFDTPYVHDSLAVFVSRPDRNWLSVTPASRHVHPEAIALVSATCSASKLDPGSYRARILFFSNDPDKDTVVVPVHLNVTESLTETAATPGDLNEDGILDIRDAQTLINALFLASNGRAGKAASLRRADVLSPNADMNRDGITDIYDAILLIRKIWQEIRTTPPSRSGGH